MIKTARLIILTFLALSASCTVGPDYKKPQIDAPPHFVLQDIFDSLNQGRSGKEFSANWWKGFSDLTLDQLVLSGLEKNFQVAAARSRLNEASARVALAGAGNKLQSGVGLDGDLEGERELNQVEDTKTARITGNLDFALPWTWQAGLPGESKPHEPVRNLPGPSYAGWFWEPAPKSPVNTFGFAGLNASSNC